MLWELVIALLPSQRLGRHSCCPYWSILVSDPVQTWFSGRLLEGKSSPSCPFPGPGLERAGPSGKDSAEAGRKGACESTWVMYQINKWVGLWVCVPMCVRVCVYVRMVSTSCLLPLLSTPIYLLLLSAHLISGKQSIKAMNRQDLYPERKHNTYNAIDISRTQHNIKPRGLKVWGTPSSRKSV